MIPLKHKILYIYINGNIYNLYKLDLLYNLQTENEEDKEEEEEVTEGGLPTVAQT